MPVDGGLGDRFREARTAAGLSQRALASRAGLGHAAIARIETGAREPNMKQATAIANVLGVPSLTEGIPDAETAEQLRRQRISIGKKGKARPDASERMRRLHAEKRATAKRAKGELLDAAELAAKRGVSPHAVIAAASAGLVEPVRLEGVCSLKGQPRIFFPLKADWPRRGETGRRAWEKGEGFAIYRIAPSHKRPSWNRWHRKWKVSGKRPIEEREPAKAQRALELRDEMSLRSIERITGLTKRQLEGLFARHPKLVSP
jgi:transcriptional regulator with XRE-family HTH domain